MVEPIDKIKSLMAKALSPGAEDSEEGARCALFAVKLMKKYGFTVVAEAELGALKSGAPKSPAPRAEPRPGTPPDSWPRPGFDDWFSDYFQAGRNYTADDFINSARAAARAAGAPPYMDPEARRRAAENLRNSAPGGSMFNGWAQIRARVTETCVNCQSLIPPGSTFWWGPTSKRARCIRCGPSRQVGDPG